MELTLNDFFCGCGGMGIGFIDAGWKIVGAWDFDKFAVQSYKHNVGEHVIQADIKALSWKDIPKATAWAFGFPCQDMSVAGKQKGFRLKCKKCESEWQHTEEDTDSPKCPECGSQEYEAATRSAMFFEMMRLVEETRTNAPDNLPAVLVAENVKGLKKYIPVLIEELNKHGYIAHIELYNSKFFDVSQNRERYYIVSTREDLPDTFTMPAKQEDNLVPPLSQFLDKDVDEKYYIPDDRAQKIIEQALQRLEKLEKVHPAITPDRVDKRQNGRRAKEDETEMFTLTAQDIHGVIIDDTYGYGDARIYPEQSPTLRNSRQGLKVVEESTILRPVRTEHGKEIRKQYEAGEVTEKWSDMRELEPRTDGICNTLTTVLKDNLLMEKQDSCIVQLPRGKNEGNVHDIAPTITSNSYQENNVVLEASDKGFVDCVINDRGFVNREPQVSETAPTLRAQDHGNIPKVIEVAEDTQIEKEICTQSGLLNPDGVRKTLRVGGSGSLSKKHNYQHVLIASEPELHEPCIENIVVPCISSEQAHATVNDDLSPALTAAAGMGGGQTAMVLDPPKIVVMGLLKMKNQEMNKRVYDPNGLAPTLTTCGGGGTEKKIFDYSRLRVRKLTPTEYGRLQAFPVDGDWEQVVSDSQAYKQFGNAVTTTVAKTVAGAISKWLQTIQEG